MARSHPPTLLTLLGRTWREEIRVERPVRVLVAVSGGVDSMVLLNALARSRRALGAELFAHGVDHGLRREACAELDLAEQYAASLGVTFSRTRVEVGSGGNLQARARAARYVALRAAAASVGAGLIATAHHADDRAETVLLRLLRGTSPRGLGVLPARASDLVRPLIRARRADIAAHATRHGVPFCEDPSNRNARFLRTRVRLELLPLLEALSPGIVRNLNALADETLAGPAPAILDEDGAPIALGRAQRAELVRMLEANSPRRRLRVSGGRELSVEPSRRRIVVRS